MRYHELFETTLWHGSRHRFSVFKIERVGTGEGHDAYGFGLYFAENRKVAEYYRKKLSNIAYKGKPFTSLSEQLQEAIMLLLNHRWDKEEVKRKRGEFKWADEDTQVHIEDKKWSKLVDSIDQDDVAFTGGHLYEVEIPDDDRFMINDLPFRKQSKFVQTALRKMAKTYTSYLPDAIKDNEIGDFIYVMMRNFNRNNRRSREEDKQSSLDMLAAGIMGIKYFDEDSREAQEGHFNYVVFDPRIIKVIKRH